MPPDLGHPFIFYINIKKIHIYVFRCVVLLRTSYIFVLNLLTKQSMDQRHLHQFGGHSKIEGNPAYYEVGALFPDTAKVSSLIT